MKDLQINFPGPLPSNLLRSLLSHQYPPRINSTYFHPGATCTVVAPGRRFRIKRFENEEARSPQKQEAAAKKHQQGFSRDLESEHREEEKRRVRALPVLILRRRERCEVLPVLKKNVHCRTRAPPRPRAPAGRTPMFFLPTLPFMGSAVCWGVQNRVCSAGRAAAAGGTHIVLKH